MEEVITVNSANDDKYAQLGWFAGILDGEGCIMFRLNNNKIEHFSVTVSNTVIEVVNKFQERWGGNIRYNKPPQPQYKICYVWRLCNIFQIRSFLLSVLPYLIVKRDKAITLLFYLQKKTKTDHKKYSKDALLKLTFPSTRRDLCLQIQKEFGIKDCGAYYYIKRAVARGKFIYTKKTKLFTLSDAI